MEKQLYESQKLSALGQLSAGIAHEIRNPLSSIKMSLQILAKRMTPEGNDLKRFKIAEKEVEHLERYVAPLEGRRTMLRLDFNENTVGPSPLVVEAIPASSPQ